MIHKLTSHLRFEGALGRAAGFRAAAEWEYFAARRFVGLKEPERWEIRPKCSEYPVSLRLRGASDIFVFEQIFLSEQYSCVRDLKDVKTILDLGANTGLSGAYFLSCFPQARLFAVEPDPEIAALCRTNLAPFGGRAAVFTGAVWSRNTTLRLAKGEFRDGREWATQVVEDGVPDKGGAPRVQAWTVPELLQMCRIENLDLMKVDIERAELEVFDETARQWLPQVRNICIELHDSACEAAFDSALESFEYDRERSGELTICRNLRSKVAQASSSRITGS